MGFAVWPGWGFAVWPGWGFCDVARLGFCVIALLRGPAGRLGFCGNLRWLGFAAMVFAVAQAEFSKKMKK